MSNYKKAFLQSTTKLALSKAYEAMDRAIDKAIESGAIDIESYDTENNFMVLPKAILIAVLEQEAEQYKGQGTSFEKQIKKDVKNLKHFI